MAKIDLAIPALGDKFFDLRDNLPGDSYNWSWERALSDVKYLVIHHSASSDTQTPQEIANYHIENNGWGGIGYHFLVDKQGQVFYVGDISTARANVANMNEAVIGIGLIGNFTQGRVPTPKQLDSTQKLCEFFIADYPDLQIKGHMELPNQKTICPGDTWLKWRQTLMDVQTIKTQKVHPESSEILKSQVENLQTDIAYLEQQRINLQETLQQREEEITNLKSEIVHKTEPDRPDNTLTIAQGLINLYKFILPRKVAPIQSV